ncbi:hypothetical protein FACS189447_07640 [Spirochaetia bacterium]|nr:hypothetical protein FACS189447_07640 [Spirochaetia bacterium]
MKQIKQKTLRDIETALFVLDEVQCSISIPFDNDEGSIDIDIPDYVVRVALGLLKQQLSLEILAEKIKKSMEAKNEKR